MVKTWWRLGCSADLSEAEIDRLQDGDATLLKQLFADGRFTLDGESYVPDGCLGDLDGEICIDVY